MNSAELLIQLAVALVFGGITAAIAYSKGRNAFGWFCVGFLVACVGLIIILCMSNLKEEEAKWKRTQEGQRRLREQLRQERMKNAGFQQHVHKRLDVHDQALNMDTREVGQSEPPPLLEAPDEATDEKPTWYYVIEHQRLGPVTAGALKSLLQSGQITQNTLVWRGGFDNWKPISQVSQLLER